MGVSDFKIFMFENNYNKAQIDEKVPTLHQSRYLKNAPTDFSVKLQAVRVRILSIFAQAGGSRTETGVT